MNSDWRYMLYFPSIRDTFKKPEMLCLKRATAA